MTIEKEEMQGNEYDEINISKKKILYFYNQKIPIHIKLNNGKWMNGEIILIEVDLFIIKDFKRGEVPVMYEEINNIEKYKMKES